MAVVALFSIISLELCSIYMRAGQETFTRPHGDVRNALCGRYIPLWTLNYIPVRYRITRIDITRRMQSICGRAQRAEEARPATFARCAGTHAHRPRSVDDI